MRVNKKKKQLNFFDKIMLGLSFLLGLALLVSYFSPITDPRKFWAIAFFGLAYPALLLANCLLLVYWIIRQSKYILLPLICILSGWSVLRDNIGFRRQTTYTTPNQPNALRVMTYNAHNFKRYGANNDSLTKHEMLRLIDDQRPDIIGIEEFYSRKRGQYAIKDSMKKIMKSEAYYFNPFSFDNGREAMGMAIFSKFPITNKGFVMLSTDNGSSNQCIFVDVKKANQTFRFYAVHLQSIGFDPEDYDYLTKVSKQGEADLTSSRRIGSKLKRAFLRRSEQVAKVKAHATQCPYPYIIAGDFNDTPSSFAVNQMSKGLSNTFRKKGSGFARTYNGSFPNYQIDYIMASPAFEVMSYHIIQKKLSDHYPVCSTLLLKQ
jgi:endonuclease/exonuclease/phosphatase family metal-dependent hydrolase